MNKATHNNGYRACPTEHAPYPNRCKSLNKKLRMNIKIRKWQESDIDNLVRYANNQNISNNLADAFPFPYSREFGLKFIKRVSSEHPTKIFAITSDNKPIGSIGIFPDKATLFSVKLKKVS